jgi:hypothetical protein
MHRRIASFTAISLIAVACSAPGASSGASHVPGTSQAASQSSGPGASQGGGGGTSNACDLITAAEAASVTGVASTTAQGSGDDPFYCSYISDGQPVVLTSLISTGADSIYATYAAEQGATLVSGIGDKAVFSPSTFSLYIVKGGRLMGISAGTGSLTQDQRLDLEKQLGTIAAGRL